MIKLVRIVISLLVCFVFVGALRSAPIAKAAPANPPQPQQIFSKDGNAVGVKATVNEAATNAARWTLEARQAAKPLEVNSNPSDLNSIISDSGGGTPIFKPGKMADPAALEEAKTKYPDAWAAMSNHQSSSLPMLEAPSLVNPQGTKGVFDGYLGNYWTIFYNNYPYYVVGRLYFNDLVYGGSYWCTAALISPNSIVATAAHCMYNTDLNYWYDDWVFVPDDYYGNDPLGYYPYYTGWVNYKGWMLAKSSSKGAAYDVGLLQFYNNPSYYGWLGWAVNLNTKSLVHTIGYSTNVLSGGPSYICVAESYPKGSDVIGEGCDMNNTAGGSPSIYRFFPLASGAINYASAVIHGGSTGTNIYSTRFSSKNFVPLCILIGC